MSGFRRFWLRLYHSLFPNRADHDVAREIESHITILADDYRRLGMSDAEAHAAALRRMGSPLRAKERHRESRAFPRIEDAVQDVTHALRLMRRTSGFAAVVIVTVALGIGAATAVFSVVKAVLLEPLPYAQPEALVRLIENLPPAEAPRTYGATPPMMNVASFLTWRERTAVFSHMAAFGYAPPGILTTPNGPVQVTRAAVSPAVFPMLGIRALRGRVFDTDDEKPGSAVIVLSETAWRRHFAGDEAIVGRAIQLEGRPYTVVGIVPGDTAFPTTNIDCWTAYVIQPPQPNRRLLTEVVARLAPGATIEQARAEARALGDDRRFSIVNMQEHLVASVRPALLVLTVAVGCVLLLVCANVANLLLARGLTRQREMGVRLAMGAGRTRLIRQLLAESLVLSIAGGLSGMGLAAAAVRAIKSLASVDTPALFQLSTRMQLGGSVLPRLEHVDLDSGVLLVSLCMSVAVGVLFGLFPAVHFSRVEPLAALTLRGSDKPPRAARGQSLSARTVLSVAQLALATTVLIGAALLVHSFVKLTNVSTGYDPDGVVTFQLTFPPQYPTHRKAELTESIVSRVRALPGVTAAGFTNIPPLLPVAEYAGLVVPPGRTTQEMLSDSLRPQTRSAGPGYLEAIGARLVAGRWIEPADGGSAERVALVNRALTRHYFDSRLPVGEYLEVQRGLTAVTRWKIVGVVEDVRQARLDEEPYPLVFMHPQQMLAALTGPSGVPAGNPLGFLFVAIRSRDDADVLVALVRDLVKSLDSSSGLHSVATLEQLVAGSVVRPRFFTTILSVFAGLATIIAAVGIYGVLSFVVSQRTREIGVRMALGAQAGEVLRLVLRQAAYWTVLGIGAGVGAAALLSRYLSTLLYGLTARDAGTYATVAVLFSMVAIAAAYLPARRATRIDPFIVLRCD